MTVRRILAAIALLSAMLGLYGAWLLWARCVGLRFE